MTVTTDRMQLFSVTIRRTYTAKHRAQWSDLPEYSDSSHPEWGESAEAVVERWATIHDNVQPYWLEQFRDEVLMVEPLDAEQAPRRGSRADRCASATRIGAATSPSSGRASARSATPAPTTASSATAPTTEEAP